MTPRVSREQGAESLQFSVLPACILLSTFLGAGELLRQTRSAYLVCRLDIFTDNPARFLFYQSFGIDACFRFKRRQISSYEKDPELGPGLAYVVAWEPYREYLLSRTKEEDVSIARII